MRTVAVRALLATLTAGTVFAGGAAADPPRGPAPALPGDNISPERKDRLREEVIDQMRALRMWKVTEELKLDEAGAAKVFPLLARFDDKIRELGKSRRETMRVL